MYIINLFGMFAAMFFIITLVNVVVSLLKPSKADLKTGNESILSDCKTRLESPYDPLKEDLIDLYATQAESIGAQIRLLTKAYALENDTKKKAAIMNKLTIAQGKLIKVKQAEYKLWNT